jgi:hypothetical protein
VLPSWVKHKDGRRTPFDADVISRRLFAAAQSLGPADAFLVRELTDGVLHFLDQEGLGDTASAESIDDIAEKIVRELGQPALAAAFAARPALADESPRRLPLTIDFAPDDSPDDIAGRCLDAFSLRGVFAPDIAAAHAQGLIHLGGLRTPQRLDAVVLEPAAVQSGDPFDVAWELVATGAARAGRNLVLDSPEWLVADGAVPGFVRGLTRAAQAQRRGIDVHLNAATPPPWAEERGTGPLFAAPPAPAASSPQSWLAALTAAAPRVNLVWHWRNDSASDAPFAHWLAQSPDRWSVMFDRPNQPITLSHGLSRRRPGISMTVGLDLPALLNRPDVSCQGDRFLEKLPSLARLAVSAGGQKRAYLRRQASALTREFLLDRAAVRIEPLGMATVLQQLLGVAAPISKPARVLVRKILLALQSPLAACRKRTGLDVMLDAPDLAPIDPAPSALFLEHEDISRGAVTPECHRLRFAGDATADAWLALLKLVWQKGSAVGALCEPRGDLA